MSIATIVTRGYGGFGSIPEVVTRGYIATVSVTPGVTREVLFSRVGRERISLGRARDRVSVNRTGRKRILTRTR